MQPANYLVLRPSASSKTYPPQRVPKQTYSIARATAARLCRWSSRFVLDQQNARIVRSELKRSIDLTTDST